MRRSPPDGYVRIGRLGKSFKVAGGVRLWLESEGAGASLDAFGRLFVSGLGETRIRAHEIVSGSAVVYLEGVRDRTVARSLVNAEVWADTTEMDEHTLELLEEPADEELLIGLDVTLDGQRVGEVVEAVLGGANQYVEIALDDGPKVLLPLAAPYVSVGPAGIDLVDPPRGLLGPDA
ncbi:MAG TPA: hypothetical protein VFD39_12045 [Trueperaceae bacterium]|nr:hypothetical protein [Trueperaceae bacterium]